MNGFSSPSDRTVGTCQMKKFGTHKQCYSVLLTQPNLHCVFVIMKKHVTLSSETAVIASCSCSTKYKTTSTVFVFFIARAFFYAPSKPFSQTVYFNNDAAEIEFHEANNFLHMPTVPLKLNK